MSSNTVKFTSTKLASVGKQGRLTPNADGYYELVVGGLNVYNSAGEYYTLNGAKQLFERSSEFMRRVQNGCLKAENGHPVKQPGMSNDDFFRRIATIDPARVCGHFNAIWLNADYGRQSPAAKSADAVAIMATVRPSGEQAHVLQSALDNPHENVCFSIRALTQDYRQGNQINRVLHTIYTFDLVIEPGIAGANKFDSPALETVSETPVLRTQLERLVREIRSTPVAMETASLLTETVETLRRHDADTKTPVYYRW